MSGGSAFASVDESDDDAEDDDDDDDDDVDDGDDDVDDEEEEDEDGNEAAMGCLYNELRYVCVCLSGSACTAAACNASKWRPSTVVCRNGRGGCGDCCDCCDCV